MDKYKQTIFFFSGSPVQNLSGFLLSSTKKESNLTQTSADDAFSVPAQADSLNSLVAQHYTGTTYHLQTKLQVIKQWIELWFMKDLCIHLFSWEISVEVAVKSRMVCLEVFAAVSHLFWPLSLLTCWSSGSEHGSGICSSALLDEASHPTHSSHSCCSWCSWSPSCCGSCCDRSQTPRLGTRVRTVKDHLNTQD